MGDTAGPGLRDRKRTETRARLEEAAATLALRDGLDAATVDAISERAGVSARTFFNYFDSKEDAVLGLREVVVEDAVVQAFVVEHDGAGAAESVVGLLFAVFGSSITDVSAHRTRREVLRRFPHLLGRQVEQMTRLTGQLTTAVQTVLARPGHPPVDAAVAEAVLHQCAGALRIALREWAAAPPGDAAGGTAQATLQLRTTTLVQEAAGILR